MLCRSVLVILAMSATAFAEGTGTPASAVAQPVVAQKAPASKPDVKKVEKAPVAATVTEEDADDNQGDGDDNADDNSNHDTPVEYVAPSIPLPPKTIIPKIVAQGVPLHGVLRIYQFMEKNDGQEFVQETYECVKHPHTVAPCNVAERVNSQQKLKIHIHPYSVYIDFTKPSSQERFYVINWTTGKVTKYLTTHGQHSGSLTPYKFSNRMNSSETSLGLAVTGNVYWGKHGITLRTYGVEKSNDNSYKRDIVIHPSWYAKADFLKKINKKTKQPYGRLGLSFGCPALAPDVGNRLIPLLRGGAIVFSDSPSLMKQALTGKDVVGPMPQSEKDYLAHASAPAEGGEEAAASEQKYDSKVDKDLKKQAATPAPVQKTPQKAPAPEPSSAGSEGSAPASSAPTTTTTTAPPVQTVDVIVPTPRPDIEKAAVKAQTKPKVVKKPSHHFWF